jgi:hypothetical protein
VHVVGSCRRHVQSQQQCLGDYARTRSRGGCTSRIHWHAGRCLRSHTPSAPTPSATTVRSRYSHYSLSRITNIRHRVLRLPCSCAFSPSVTLTPHNIRTQHLSLTAASVDHTPWRATTAIPPTICRIPSPISPETP